MVGTAAVRGVVILGLAATAWGSATAADPAVDARQALIARARALELPTPYVPPPGDPLSHMAAGYAKILCSSVFITGLGPAFARENVGYFTAPYAVRQQLGAPRIDRAHRSVDVPLSDGKVRSARQLGSQGCVTLAAGESTVNFTPSIVHSALPDPSTQPWHMGDVPPDSPLPPGLDSARLQAAVAQAFDPAAMTAALVVTYRGRIVAERYGAGIGPTTPLERWSMGKRLAATLLGVLIEKGAYTLEQPAPIPEWQPPGDPRAADAALGRAVRDILAALPPATP